ncbi:MAG: T9SS type A sorting domain-containing protein [Bacteroidales bacterium]|jgi:PKD repeat protein|nr:T9SS type A sorting domain-containing protein [Bacteroidales bacterium]
MKLRLLFITLLTAGIIDNIQAQLCTTNCITNMNFTASDAGGYCPNPIPDAVVNEFYDLNLTIIAPATGDLNGTSITVNYIDIVNIENLPEGLTWCKSTDKFKHNEPNCMHLWGIPTKTGDYQLSIKVKATVLGGLISVDRTDNTLTLHVIKSKNPEVAFTSDTQMSRTGEPVHFFDNTDSTASLWEWIFEGGTPAISTEKNPTVVWENSGTYSVSLTAYNSYGNKRLVKYNYIRIADRAGHYPPIAAISANKRKVIIQEPVQLSATNTEHFTEWINNEDNSIHQQYGYPVQELPTVLQWYFEGGVPQESTDFNPVVFWSNPGQYAISLKVTGASGSDELRIERYITVEGIDIFTFYPNPCHNILTVEAPGMNQISIYDMQGRCIIRKDAHPTHQEIDVSSLFRGVYIVSVRYQNGKVKGKKLIVD